MLAQQLGQAETGAEFSGTPVGDAQGASVLAASNPAQREQTRAESRAENTGKVRSALGPVDALTGEATAGTAELLDINIEAGEPTLAMFAKFEVARTRFSENARILQRTRKFDGNAAGEMVVACAREVEIARRGRTRGIGRAWPGGNGAEGLESMGDVRAGQRVVAVTSGGADGKQAAIEKLGEVTAGGLGRDVSGECEFTGGASTSIEQGDKNGRTRGITDEFSYSCDRVGGVHGSSVARGAQQRFIFP